MITTLALLALAAQGTTGWQLTPNSGVAESRDGIVRVSGEGVARYAMPNLGDSWKISFEVRHAPGSGSPQFVSVGGDETLLRLKISDAPTVSATVYRIPTDVQLVDGNDWHKVDLYGIRGSLTMCWDGVVERTTPYSNGVRNLYVGSQGLRENPPACEAQVRQVGAERVDNTLANIPPDIPVKPESAWSEEDVIAPLFDANAPQQMALEADGGIAVFENGLSLTAPPLSKITLAPNQTLNYHITEAALILSGELVTKTRPWNEAAPLPGLTFTLTSRDDSVSNAVYEVSLSSTRQTAIQRLHMTADDGLADYYQVAADQNGYAFSTKLPANSLLVYDSGSFLGSMALSDGAAQVPFDKLPSGDNKWLGLLTDGKGTFWGPIPISLKLANRAKIDAKFIAPRGKSPNRKASISVTPDSSEAGMTMRIFVNKHLVQESPASAVQRTVLLDANDSAVSVDVDMVGANQAVSHAGTFALSLPVPGEAEARGIFQTYGNSTVVVETVGNPPTPIGAGFVFYSPEYVATCYHLVKGLPSVRVAFADGKTQDVKQVLFDDAADLAVLVLTQGSGHTALQAMPLAEVGAGSRAFLIEPTLTPGTANLFTNSVDLGTVTRIPSGGAEFSAKIIPGGDGSPLVDGRGRVIGVVNVLKRTARPRVTRLAVSTGPLMRLIHSVPASN